METEKTERIAIRLTPSEKEEIIKKAEQAHLTISGYILSLSENKRIVVAEKIPQLLLEITRIGTNINQIAHIGNTQKFLYREQLDEVIKLLENVKSCMQKILSEIYNQDEHTLKSLERKIDLLIERTEKQDGNM